MAEATTLAPRVRDSVAGVAIALTGVLALWATSEFQRGLPPAGDPALLPRALGVGLIVVGIAITATGLLRRPNAAGADDAEGVPLDIEVPEELAEDADDETEGAPEWWVVGGLVTSCLAYSWAAFRLGFITSTFTFLMVTSILLGRPRSARGWIILTVFSVAITVVAHITFFVLLNTRPPLTPLP